MLVNFSFSNFRSFKNPAVLSMEAGRQTSLKDSLIKNKGLKLIPSSVIYGANASGKSNIIMALSVMKEIILTGNLNADIPQLNNLELYPFLHDAEERPINFEIDFISSAVFKSNKRVYQNAVIMVKNRDELKAYLESKGIETLISWAIPLHKQPSLNLDNFNLPITERISREVISLPMYPELTDKEIMYVIDTVRGFYGY